MVVQVQGIQNVPKREEKPIEEILGVPAFTCTRFHDYPTLFPYQADANTFANGDDMAGEDRPLLLQSSDRDRMESQQQYQPEGDGILRIRRRSRKTTSPHNG